MKKKTCKAQNTRKSGTFRKNTPWINTLFKIHFEGIHFGENTAYEITLWKNTLWKNIFQKNTLF